MKKKKFGQLRLAFSNREQQVYLLLEKMVIEKPSLFDQNLFKEFKLLSAIKDELFFECRSIRHLLKLISMLGYLRWKLVDNSGSICEYKQCFLKFLPSVVSYPFGSYNVLGIAIGFTRISQYERLEEKHIIKAFKKIIQGVEYVRGSYYCNDDNDNQHTLTYIELRKYSGEKFNPYELFTLKRDLSSYLKDHIETLVPSVFNVRNEEEIGKTLFVLNRELCSEKDIPQISIFYEGQSSWQLTFTVVCLYSENINVDELVKDHQNSFRHISPRVERRLIAGYFNNNVEKKAVVLTLLYEINPEIQRSNFSINLPKVRENIVSFLVLVFGEFRDYNGGLYFKQNHQLKELQSHLISEESTEFIERVFYGIFPIENQATLPIEELVFFVDVIRDVKNQNVDEMKNVLFKSVSTDNTLAIVFKSDQGDLHDLVFDSLTKNQEASNNMVFTKFKIEGYFFTGILLTSQSKKKNEALKEKIQECILEWRGKLQKYKTLNLSIANSPISLDPRRGGEEVSSTVLRFLFEGLVKFGSNGKIELGIATEVLISKDQKRYTFFLKETCWSNGTSVTAEDFVYSWTKSLSPDFFTPFCYLFYPIKNAKLVKEGKAPIKELGIKALDQKTLQVDLEKPITYFLELLAHNLYFPIPKFHDSRCPNWENLDQALFICNGPFVVEHQTKEFFVFKKNKNYWKSKSIFFDKVFISKNTNSQALNAFEKGEIDWLGAPLHPWDVTFHIKNHKKTLKDAGSSEVLWVVNNVSNPYLKNLSLRRALAYSINRKEILRNLGHNGLVANSILPRIYSRFTDSKLDKGDIVLAKTLYEKAQNDLGGALPKFKLYTSHGGVREKIAIEVRNQWEEKLGFICEVQRMEWKDLFKLMVTGDFQLATTMWKPLIDDPMYTLNIFESNTHPVNFSNWESSEFQQILSEHVGHNSLRLTAEKKLLQDFPVIPLIYEEQCFMKSSKLTGFHSHMGRIDFSEAFFKEYESRNKESFYDFKTSSIS